jgi:hypothetical protein
VYELAQAPIAPGSERCVRLADGGFVGRTEGLEPSESVDSFLVDTQLEALGRHPVLRLMQATRTIGFDLDRHPGGVSGLFWLGINDDWLYGVADLSGTTGKRLAVRFDVPDRVVLVDEIQPWGPPVQRRVPLAPGAALVNNWEGFRVGGASGEVPGQSYRGRVAEVAIFSRVLGLDSVEGFRHASLPANETDVPSFNPGALNDEGREIFLADYAQLVGWHNKGSLTHRELRDASSLAHLWLLDTYPLLQRVSNNYGAMLSCPDLRRAATLAARVEADKPALWWPQTEHSGDWVPLSTFRDDLACWLGQRDYPITWTAFIKFIRNKLGAGHYDPDDRQRWQHELAELAAKEEIEGEPWLASMMLTLVRSLILTADGSGLVGLARDGP